MLLQVRKRLDKGDRRGHSALLLFVVAIPLGVPRVNSSCLQREGGRDTHKGCRYCYDTGGKNREEGLLWRACRPKQKKAIWRQVRRRSPGKSILLGSQLVSRKAS